MTATKWANLPTTCADFVAHPHKVETTFTFTDKDGNKREETKLSGCYTCQMALASEEQGTTALASALMDADIACEVVQTGGFTMCVYIKLEDDSYIYANAEGFSYYKDAECEGIMNAQWRPKESTPQAKAEGIRQTLIANNWLAVEI
jgi:hypothetical protein